MNLVVDLSGRELAGEETDRTQEAVETNLGDHTTQAVTGAVCLYNCREFRVVHSEDRGADKDFLHAVEGVLVDLIPSPYRTATGEVVQRSSNVCKLWRKLAVKIGKAEERAYSRGICRCFPCRDSFNLVRVDSDTHSGFNNKA